MPFKKGDPRINRNGRPKTGTGWTEILRNLGEEKPNGMDMTRKEAICRKLYAEAAKGQQWAIMALFDRIEGKPIQVVDQTIENLTPPSVMLEIIEDNKGTKALSSE